MPEQFTYTTGKLKRSHLKNYLDVNIGAASSTPSWFILGKDVDDMSVELNPDTETVKNVLDETNITDNGYEPALDVGTYYANPSDAIYESIKDIALNRKTGDDCRTTILEVLIDKTAGPFDAWTEDVIVKPQSYGGAQGGVNIPFNVAYAGNRKKGTVTFSKGVPTFSETTASTD